MCSMNFTKQPNNQTTKQPNNQTIKTERQKLLDAVDKVEIYAKLARLNSSGRMAVEMFFIISGLLFSIKLDLNQ